MKQITNTIERKLNAMKKAYSENDQPKADQLSSDILYILSDLNEQGIGHVLIQGKWMNTEDGTF